jgi:hypothetical protein
MRSVLLVEKTSDLPQVAVFCHNRIKVQHCTRAQGISYPFLEIFIREHIFKMKQEYAELKVNTNIP